MQISTRNFLGKTLKDSYGR